MNKLINGEQAPVEVAI